MTDDQLEQAKQVIIQVFQKLRPKLMAAFGTIDYKIKHDATPVTELDTFVEQELREKLTVFDGGIGFEGEEFGRTGNPDTFWLVDAIDGTESFLRGIPWGTRSLVTLIDKDHPVMVLAYKFMSNELLEARVGHGARCNGRPMHVSDRPLERAWVEVSMPMVVNGNIERLTQLQAKTNGLLLAHDFTLVAQGQIEGYIVRGSTGGDWDYAPRTLLIQEAGGVVANIGSDSYDYRNHNFVAANPVIFEALMRIVSD